MNPYHAEISQALAIYIDEHQLKYEDAFRYLGTTKPFCYIRAADLRKIYQMFTVRHPNITREEFIALLDSLSESRMNNEYCAIGLLLEAYPDLRMEIDPFCLDMWLDHAEGWAEVDVICQFNYTAQEMLLSWQAWQALLIGFVEDENIHKRRASLVLLTKPLRESDDTRLSQLAFHNIDMLKNEKAVLITKAISWALRALIKYHRPELLDYLDRNADSLPKLALRETRNKLNGGVKEKRIIRLKAHS